MIKELQLMNQTRLNYNKSQNCDYSNNEVVAKILNDEACFFKMSKDDAMKVLSICGVSPSVAPQTYDELTSFDAFKTLATENKVSFNDPELLFTYDKFGNRKKC